MTFIRNTALGSGRRSAAAALGLALAASGCSDGDADPAESNAAARPATDEAEISQPSGSEPETVGKMTIDGQSYDLARAHWCEPEAGVESGSTVALRVAAFDESGDVIVYGLQVDREENGPPVQNVSAATDPNTNYQSGDVPLSAGPEPLLAVEKDTVRIAGQVRRRGEAVDLEAEFTLPDEPGFPGYC